MDNQKFRISYSSLSCYQQCPERYRISYIDVAEDEDGNETFSDHYYAAVGSAIQSIFEGVVNAWNNSTDIKSDEPFFDIEHIRSSYWSQTDFEYTEWLENLFSVIDEELKDLKPYIVTFNQMQNTDTIKVKALISNKILKSFKLFPVDVRRYGNIIYIAQNKFLSEVKKLYKEPLIYFIHNFLAANYSIKCEVKIKKEYENYFVTGSADFLITDKNTDKKIILDGKRLYNPDFNKDSQLIIYGSLLDANTCGFFSYKENLIYWTVPEITNEMKNKIKLEMDEMYADVKEWKSGVEQKETPNKYCQYCDKNAYCKSYRLSEKETLEI